MKLAALLLLGFQLALTSCNFISDRRIDGNGVSSTQERSVGDFHSINASGGMDVIVSQGTASSLKIEADENLLQYIETRNEGGSVEIYTRDGFNLDPNFNDALDGLMILDIADVPANTIELLKREM